MVFLGYALCALGGFTIGVALANASLAAGLVGVGAWFYGMAILAERDRQDEQV